LRWPASERLSPEAVALYDDPNKRLRYLILQAVLANLHLRERAELGHAFYDTMKKREVAGDSFLYRAMHVDSRPEWIYVLGSSTGLAPEELEKRKQRLMIGGMVLQKNQLPAYHRPERRKLRSWPDVPANSSIFTDGASYRR
jgi:hypothetical protein